MDKGGFRTFHRSNPEKKLSAMQQQGLAPFDVLVNQVSEERVIELMRDEKMMTSLLAASWPTDEKSCDRIAKEYGLGAEYVAAISAYKKKGGERKESPRTLN